MTSVELTLGVEKVQVSCEANLEDLTREAESQFDLHPGSFDLCDEYGVINSSTLQRALQVGSCVLRVRERPEWRRMREMQAQIEWLLAGQRAATARQVPSVTAAEIEARVMVKVDAAIAQLRKDLDCTDGKVEQALAPMVKSIAMTQIDFELEANAKFGELERNFDALPKALLQEFEASAEVAASRLEEHRAAASEESKALSCKVAALSKEVAGMRSQSAMSEDLRSLGGTPLTPMRRPSSRGGTLLSTVGGTPLGLAPEWEAAGSKKNGLGSKSPWLVEAVRDAAESPAAPQLSGSRSATFLPRVLC